MSGINRSSDVSCPCRGHAAPGFCEESVAVGGGNELRASLAGTVGVDAAEPVCLSVAPVPLVVRVALVRGHVDDRKDTLLPTSAFKEVRRPENVGRERAEWVGVGGTNEGLRGKVEHTLRLVICEDLRHLCGIADIADDRIGTASHVGTLKEARSVGGGSQRKTRHLRPQSSEPDGQPAALEPRVARHEDTTVLVDLQGAGSTSRVGRSHRGRNTGVAGKLGSRVEQSRTTDTRRDEVSLNKLVVAAVTSLAVSIVAIIASFFAGFDVTDEGSLLYAFAWGEEAIHLSPFYLPVSHVGELFGHRLVGYRFLNLSLILAGAVAVALAAPTRCVDRAWQQRVVTIALVCQASLVVYAFTSVLHYNNVIAVGVSLWVAGTLRVRAEATTRVGYAALVVAGALVLFARPPVGLLFCVLTPPALWLIARDTRVRHGLVAWGVATFLLVGIAGYVYREPLAGVWSLYVLHLTSSHTGLLGQYLRQTALFLVSLAASAFIVEAVRRRPRLGVAALGICLLVAAISIPMLDLIDPLAAQRDKLVYLLVVLLASIALHSVWRIRRRAACPGTGLSGDWVLPIICFGPALLSGVSSNGNIFRYAGYCMGVLALPTIAFLKDATEGYRRYRHVTFAAICLLAGATLVMIYLGQYRFPYRTGPFEVQREETAVPRLSGVRIEEPLRGSLDALRERLDAVGFDRNRDRLFAYPDLPGFAAALALRSYAYPWVYSGYVDVDELNCGLLALSDTTRTRNVWLLLGAPLAGTLRQCVHRHLQAAPDLKRQGIGSLRHYRNERDLDLELIGPYRLLSDDEAPAWP
jgi:GNAT superfamily N-acetyltransferase